MNDFPNEFKNEAYRVRLTEAERSRIRASFRKNARLVPSPYAPVFSYFTYSRGLAVAFSLVLILGGAGGTLYASEHALPGDTLYTIKTSVAEPISGVFAVSAEAEGEWHATLAVKRLAEAEALAKEGRLTDENGAELAVAFKAHADAVVGDKDAHATADANIAEADADARDSVREALDAVVAAKGASILNLTDTDEHRNQRVASAHFVLSVLGDDDREYASMVATDAPADTRMMKSASEANMDAEPIALTALSVPAPEAVVVAVSENLEDVAGRAKDAFNGARERAAQTAHMDTHRELGLIFRLLVTADAKRAAGDEARAKEDYLEVLRRSDAITEDEARGREVKGWMDSSDSRTWDDNRNPDVRDEDSRDTRRD